MTERRRKRRSGPFPCPHSDCAKVFSRSDHLARHAVNHSSNKFRCEWPACGRSFNRLDVKKKHENRHAQKGDMKDNATFKLYGDNENINNNASNTNATLVQELHPFSGAIAEERALSSPFFISDLRSNIAVNSHPDKLDLTANNAKIHKLNARRRIETISDYTASSTQTQNGDIELMTNISGEVSIDGIVETKENTIRSQPSPGLPHARTQAKQQHNNISSTSRTERYQEIQNSDNPNNVNNNSLGMRLPNSEPLSPSQSIQWLLQDSINTSPSDGRSVKQPEFGAFYAYQDGPLGSTTIAMLEEIFALTPEFPNADCQTKIDDDLLFKMMQCIPELQNHPDFVITHIKWFLEVYWLLYHCQYPILHRPSFSTFDTQPLLLLGMIMMGASFSKKTAAPDHINLVDPDGLADMIADPLRWLIFACKQAKPPCKSWVIQTLIILETYEVTSTSRSFHERACIYNGAKVQLLRRSPILGGDPLKAVGSDVSQSNSLWNTWIESESMKRVALMSFYIDTIHAVVYGHPVNLFANQIKLSLPCPDDLWEYNNVDRNKAPMFVAQTPLFCDALRKLLQKETIDVGPFGMQILLAGLINLLLQIEQNISQWSNFGWDSIQESWRDTVSSAIEFWRTQLPGGDCCLTSSSVYHSDIISLPALPPFLKPEDTRCSFPVYHAAQIYFRITHYDYIVYAGAPKRMNVPILQEDYEVVVKRIGKWAKSPSGPLCVINSFILLCEVLLSPEDSMEMVNYFYEPDKDPFLYRPNIVISAILSLWAYAYYSFGPESSFKSANSDCRIYGDCSPTMEDAPTYLGRIRNQFRVLTGKSFANLNRTDSEAYSNTIKEYYHVFPKIDHINYIAGLLTLLRNSYIKCKWEVGREYAKLLDNCIQRSLGSENIFCNDMYDVNL